MLDPLMTTEQKEAAAKAEKAATEKALGAPAVVETPITDQDGVDNHSSAPLTDAEVSFDIGGVDLPDFDAITAETTTDTESSTGGMFLSGGKVLSASESEAANAETSESDISIGLVQGATAGSSDAIMDITA